MKSVLLIALCLVLLCTGCVEEKSKPQATESGKTVSENSQEKLIVTISSPKSGEILQGNKDVRFDASVKGGKAPYTYRWSSNIDGSISTSSSFSQNPSKLGKGGHVIILEVTDANGNSEQGSVLIEVM
jgi:hypothetical protein